MAACAQVIAEVSLERDGDADYDRKLDALRREEELIVEEAKEAAALLQTDIPVIQPGQVGHSSFSGLGGSFLGMQSRVIYPSNLLAFAVCQQGKLVHLLTHAKSVHWVPET